MDKIVLALSAKGSKIFNRTNIAPVCATIICECWTNWYESAFKKLAWPKWCRLGILVVFGQRTANAILQYGHFFKQWGKKILGHFNLFKQLSHAGYFDDIKWHKLIYYWITLGCVSLQWRDKGCDSVPNHQPRDCLLNRLFSRRSKKTSKLHVTGLCPGPVKSPHKWPVTRKMFPFDGVIMYSYHGIVWIYTVDIDAGTRYNHGIYPDYK